MYRHLYILLALFFIGTAACLAQNFVPRGVTAAQLEEKFYPADSTAPAVMLHHMGKTEIRLKGFRWQLVTTITTRIKIYKAAGYKYADKEVRFVNFEGYGCTVSAAGTYNLEDGKVVKSVLEDGQVYVDKLNDYYSVKKIHMPNVKEGSIIEYTYEVIYPGISYVPKWYFQQSIPVVYSEFEISLPTYFTFNRFMTGNIPVTETPPKLIEQTPVAVKVIDFKAKDVPVIKEEPLSGEMINYISAVWFEVAAVDYSQGEFVEKFSTDWVSLTQSLYKDEDFGLQLKPRSYFRKGLKQVVTDDMDALQKATAIFNFVQARMSWNERESFYTAKGVEWAYDNKVGNVADINLMLLAMLKNEGIEAYPVILSTRDNGVVAHPNHTSYNYVVVAAKINGKEILLDATDKHIRPGMLPERALNYSGRLLKPDGNSKEADLMVAEKSKAATAVMATVSPDGTVSGKARQSFTDYNSIPLREVYQPERDSLYVSIREKLSPGLTITNHQVKDVSDNSRPVTEEFEFVHTATADVAGDKIYFSPQLFFEGVDNPFTDDVRQYPVDYVYPFQVKHNISVVMPEGYAVASLPQNLRLDLPEQLGTFNYSVAVSGNVLQYIMSLDINYSLIGVDHYPQLKTFFTQAAAKQAEKIVLKKQ